MAPKHPSNKAKSNNSRATNVANNRITQVSPLKSSSFPPFPSLPPGTKLPNNIPFIIPPSFQVPWPTLSAAYAVPPDGIAPHINLVELTNLLYTPSNSYAEAKKNRLNIIHENPEMAKIPKYVKNGKKERGLLGTSCENPACSFTESEMRRTSEVVGEVDDGKPKGQVMKRCGGCRQATYCTATCQRADWSRHKPFCTSVDPTITPKDGILRLVRRLLPNPCAMVLIKAYARCLLSLDTDPAAGMKNNIVFTCTTVNDYGGEGFDDQGRRKRRRVFQISKVEKFPLNAGDIITDDAPSSDSSTGDPVPSSSESSGSSSSSSSSSLPYFPPRTSPPGDQLMSPSDLEEYRRSRLEGPYCVMTFKTDVPGCNGTVMSVEKVYKEMMRQMPIMPEPLPDNSTRLFVKTSRTSSAYG